MTDGSGRSGGRSLVTPQLPTGPLPALKSGELPKLKSSKDISPIPDTFVIPSEKVSDVSAKAPEQAPVLPEDEKPLQVPEIREMIKSLEGLDPPVLDSDGKIVESNPISLKPEVSMISFRRGSDKLDRDAIERLEKVARILKVYQAQRITLMAYSAVDGKIAPREARRISLNRAMAIRDFFTSKGILSTRIDMRPMGGNVPSGDMDRVDIRVNK
jgi:outer membrane protein OmpA-like peptidoglycan-associated protein